MNSIDGLLVQSGSICTENLALPRQTISQSGQHPLYSARGENYFQKVTERRCPIPLTIGKLARPNWGLRLQGMLSFTLGTWPALDGAIVLQRRRGRNIGTGDYSIFEVFRVR